MGIGRIEMSEVGLIITSPPGPTYCLRCGDPFINLQIPNAVRCSRCCAAISGTVSKNRREQIFERDNFICHICGLDTLKKVTIDPNGRVWAKSPTIDHLTPIVLGGSNRDDNLATAHRSCNNSRPDGEVWTP